MLPARSMLDQLIGPDAQRSLRQMAGGSGKSLATGAIAGGLAGLLLSGGKPRKLLGNALGLGGAALVGGLAYKAWQDWQAGKSAQPPAPPPAFPPALPPALPPARATAVPALPDPAGTAFLPADPARSEALAERLLRAMVAAAKADGHVTGAERRRILGQLPTLGLGAEAEALITAEIEAPLDPGAIAALATSPEEAAEIYAASLLVVDPEAPAERGYLGLLAARLGLDPALVAHLHRNADALGG